jgi:hypothetical protein
MHHTQTKEANFYEVEQKPAKAASRKTTMLAVEGNCSRQKT